MLLQQADFLGRDSLPKFLNSRGLTGMAVEIGTHQADYASHFLREWEGSLLYCIDPWEKCDLSYQEQSKKLWGSGNRLEDRKLAEDRLSKFSNRVQLVQSTSLEAADHIVDGSLDFVYIDGDHSFSAVAMDLQTWWTKLAPGGIIAGHDIVCPGEKFEDNWGRFIQPAVFRFAKPRELTVYLIVEPTALPWSYYLVKP